MKKINDGEDLEISVEGETIKRINEIINESKYNWHLERRLCYQDKRIITMRRDDADAIEKKIYLYKNG